MSRIFWDTNLFIYLFDGSDPFLEQVRVLRQRMLDRNDDLLTSTMTLAEVQVGPRKTKNYDLADRYRDAILQTSVVIPFDIKAAGIYAQIRENTIIKPPDAIQLSCAAAAGVEMFVTNDTGLHRLNIPGIHFITSISKVPFI
jgi:predicted nucleic acid-binding protein